MMFLSCTVCLGSENVESSVYRRTGFAMDTVVSETMYSSSEDQTDFVLGILDNIEEDLLSWTNGQSQISMINQNSGTRVEVSEETAEYLQKIQRLCEDSDGALDPTIGEVIRLWDIGGENQGIPEEQTLRKLLKNTGYEKVMIEGNTVMTEKGTTLDLGALGKGIGCDAVARELSGYPEITGLILNLGGSSVLAYGEKPDGSPWTVAVTDPRDKDGEYLGTVVLGKNEYLSTSGDYEKYFIEDGIRYHHIIDPETGSPARSGISSVTVVCGNGLYADGLSTACFVLGRENALPLLEAYGADALFVNGEEKQVYATEGMKDRFQLLKTSYTLDEAE